MRTQLDKKTQTENKPTNTQIIQHLSPSLSQIEDTLAPAEKGIVGITKLVDEMRPLLETLKKDFQTGTGLANDADDQANAAQDEADQAAKVPLNIKQPTVTQFNLYHLQKLCVCV